MPESLAHIFTGQMCLPSNREWAKGGVAHTGEHIEAIAVCNFNFKLQLKSAMAFIGLANNEIKIMRGMTASRRLCRYPGNVLNTYSYATYIYY